MLCVPQKGRAARLRPGHGPLEPCVWQSETEQQINQLSQTETSLFPSQSIHPSVFIFLFLFSTYFLFCSVFYTNAANTHKLTCHVYHLPVNWSCFFLILTFHHVFLKHCSFSTLVPFCPKSYATTRLPGESEKRLKKIQPGCE